MEEKNGARGGVDASWRKRLSYTYPRSNALGGGEIEEREGCLRKNKTSGKWGATDWKNKKE